VLRSSLPTTHSLDGRMATSGESCPAGMYSRFLNHAPFRLTLKLQPVFDLLLRPQPSSADMSI
jgi:hypothetical protein